MSFLNRNRPSSRVAYIVLIALLTALEVVLSRFLSVSLWNIKIGPAFLPVVVAACVCGPMGGAAVAALGDFVGALLFPIGPYFPGFTLTAALCGLCYGLCLKTPLSAWRVGVAVGFSQGVGTLLLNTLWISVLYDSPFWGLFLTRLPEACAMAAVIFAASYWLVPRIAAPLKKLFFR